MGLFSRKKVEEGPIKPLNEYLAQRAVEDLFHEAKSMAALSVSMCILSSGVGKKPAGYLSYEMTRSTYEAIPKAYRNTSVSVEDILKIATDKGHAGSAFLLAVLYEHGIYVQKNQAEADKYYKFASQMPDVNGKEPTGKLLAKAMKALTADMAHYIYTNDSGEVTAMNIWMLSGIVKGKGAGEKEKLIYNKVSEIFGDDSYLMKCFISVGLFLVAYYATTDNHPFSKFVAAIDMCSSYETYREYFNCVFPDKGEKKLLKAGEVLLGAFEDFCLAKNEFALRLASDKNYKFIFRC